MTWPRFHLAPGRSRWLPGLLLGVLAGCESTPAECPRCDTLVIAALGEPEQLLPPLVWQSVGRDIADLVFERLALLDPTRSPLDSTAYGAGLAERWERVDSVTWRFHLRPATWSDGQPVTAEDVVFAFEAHQDPGLDAVARGSLADLRATAEDPRTVRITFDRPRPDQLYDATYHVRVFPRHVWDSVPHERWGATGDPARLVGSGPYQVTAWNRGQSLVLEAVGPNPPPIRRVVWRFADAPEAASNLVLTGEADLLETIPEPARRAEFAQLADYHLQSYPSAVYGFLGFNLRTASAWSDVRVRRALQLGLDREVLAQAVFGPGTRVPDGPLSAQLWLWEPSSPAGLDTVQAARLLDEAGWNRGGDGVRRRGGRSLAIDILVPGTSATRRNLAVAIQERWARLGVRATVSAVDFPVFQERIGAGRFDSYIGAWLDEPHPRSLADQWSRSGWGQLNYGHYANPDFDALLARVVAATDPEEARRHWGEALAVLRQDVPAVWLYSPVNHAVVHARIEGPLFPPFHWLAELPTWRLTGVP